MKRTTTIYTEGDLIEEAKSRGFNISEEFTNFLRQRLDVESEINKQYSEELLNETMQHLKTQVKNPNVEKIARHDSAQLRKLGLEISAKKLMEMAK